MSSKRTAQQASLPASPQHSDTEDESHTEDEEVPVPTAVKRAAKKPAVGIKSNGTSASQQKGGNAVDSGSDSSSHADNHSSKSAPVVAAGPSSSTSSASSLVAPNITWRTLGQHESCLAGTYGNPFERAIKAGASSSTAGSSAAASSSSSTNPGRFQKIAGFDLDDTLASAKTTKLPFRFEDENDWQIWGRDSSIKKTVVEAVRAHSDAGSLLVLVSNQSTLERDQKVNLWKKRLGLIAEHIGRPFVIFAALRHDGYRKPNTDWVNDLEVMWREAGGEKAIGPLDVKMTMGPINDSSRSFYLGDAAGRKGDHNSTDRKLARNLKWRFFTPEEFFLGEKPAPWKMTGFHPDMALNGGASATAATPSPIPALLERFLSPTNPQTFLILVGPQGSGKSHIARRLDASTSWVRINRDTLKTQPRCLAAAAQALRDGKSVVIDNTSPTRAVRRAYLDLLNGDPDIPTGVRKVAVHLDFPLEVAKHNEVFRALHGEALAAADEAKRDRLPPVAFSTYYKTLEAPTMDGEEGWDEVVRVQTFEFEGSDEMRSKWAQWLT